MTRPFPPVRPKPLRRGEDPLPDPGALGRKWTLVRRDSDRPVDTITDACWRFSGLSRRPFPRRYRQEFVDHQVDEGPDLGRQMPVVRIDGVNIHLGGGFVIAENLHQPSGVDVGAGDEIADPDQPGPGKGRAVERRRVVDLEPAGDVDAPGPVRPLDCPL